MEAFGRVKGESFLWESYENLGREIKGVSREGLGSPRVADPAQHSRLLVLEMRRAVLPAGAAPGRQSRRRRGEQ